VTSTPRTLLTLALANPERDEPGDEGDEEDLAGQRLEHGEGLRGLEEGRLDAYASDRLLLAGLLTTAKNSAKLRLSDEYFSYEPHALMMRRGDNAFQARVNRKLSTLYRSGLVQIYERWFGPFEKASPLVKALYLLHSWPD